MSAIEPFRQRTPARMREALETLGVEYDDLKADRWQWIKCPLCGDTAQRWERTFGLWVDGDRCKCWRCRFGFGNDQRASSAGLLEAAIDGYTAPQMDVEPPKRKRGRPSKAEQNAANSQPDWSWLQTVIPAEYRPEEPVIDRLRHMCEVAARSNNSLSGELEHQGYLPDGARAGSQWIDVERRRRGTEGGEALLGHLVEWIAVRPALIELAGTRPDHFIQTVRAHLASKDVVSAIRKDAAGVEQVQTINLTGHADEFGNPVELDWEIRELEQHGGGRIRKPDIHSTRQHPGPDRSDKSPDPIDHALCAIGIDDRCPFRILDDDMGLWAHAMIRTIGDQFL